MVHYNDVVPDIDLNIKRRTEELAKPVLRLYSSMEGSIEAIEEIRSALSKFVLDRNQKKKNSIEGKLYEAINNLVEKRANKPGLLIGEYSKIDDPYTFCNEDIYQEAKNVMGGIDIAFKTESFYTVEFGSVSKKRIGSLIYSKFKAKDFKGMDGTRGWTFSKSILDSLAKNYNVPDEILFPKTNQQKQEEDCDRTNLENPTVADTAHFSHFKGIGGVKNDTDDRVTDTQNSTSIEENTTNEPDSSKSYNKSSSENVVDIQNSEKNTPHTPQKQGIICRRAMTEIPKNNIEENKVKIDKIKAEAESLKLPLIPCAYCNCYQHYDTFDLGNHLYKNHKQQLLALPIGKEYGMEYRIVYVIGEARKTIERLQQQSDDDDDDGNDEPNYN